MAKTNPRGYSHLTLKRLYSLAHNQCAFPTCKVTFVNWDDDTNFSNICHIEDANATTHKADRYNASMTDGQRADYKNLILLCPNHHIETNDPSKYNAAALKKMKRDHETKMAEIVSGQNLLAKNSSALGVVVSHMGAFLLEDDFNNEAKVAPSTEDKINFNNVVYYRPIIEEYSVYQGKLNSIYEEIEKQGSSKKNFLLQNIRNLYLKEKGKYSSLEDIKANSDIIFENIENEIWAILDNSSNLKDDLPGEALKMAVLVVMVDAFMRCKILEEPVKQ
jgi:hypothetical protein